jgi:uncharacterized protein YbaP (TraB family)
MLAKWALAFTGLLAGLLTAGSAAAEGDLSCPTLRRAAPHAEPTDRHARGLLWRISKGDAAPSFLFGTIHLGDPALVKLPEPVATALDSSRRFVMEAKLDADEMANWSRSMLSTNAEDLRSALGSALFGRAMALLPRYGMPEAIGAMLKPWALYLTLSTPPEMGGMPLDLVLATRVESQGKTVEGLETVTEQAGVIAGLPLDEQVALVRDAVCHYETLQGDIEQTKQLYLDRDLAALAAMASRYDLTEAARYRHLLQQLLWDRNGRMVQRMEPYLSAGAAFVAVGALHLPGPDGLLGRLEALGYRVEAVY